MRTIAAALIFWCTSSAFAVQVGDSRAAVVAELGEPANKAAAGAREFLNYAHGRVEIINGRVSDIRGSFSKPAESTPEAAATITPVPVAPAAPALKAAPSPPHPRSARWYTDIGEAQTAAAKEHKLILALFTGTDWCTPCQQFKAEVENDEQFAGIFAGSFIFFKNDWLRNSPQSEAENDETGRLKRKYWVQVYPTLLVLNSEGEKLTKIEWTKVQAGSFKEAMIEAIDDARKATKGGKKVSSGWWPF